MERTKKLIKKSKQKFFLFSTLGIVIIVTISLLALNVHRHIVDQQASIQKMYSMVGQQFGLISRISSLSEKFDQVKEGEDQELKQEFSKLVFELNEVNVKFNSWLALNKFTQIQTLEELLKTKDTDNKMLYFMKRAHELVSNKRLTQTEVKQHIRFITSSSRDGIGEVFMFISKKLEKEQEKSLAQINSMGFLLIGVGALQIVLVWMLVFRPLYNTIMEQHLKLSDAVLKAKSANRSKTDFLANVSHEIRTPMTAIMGYANILKGKDFSENEKENAVKIIDKNASHLLGLIDEILDISKIEAGKLDFENEKINLEKLLNEIYSLIEVKAKEKGIDLIFKNTGKVPKYIHGDPKRLKQIFFNILGNAIKFTDTGYVELLVSYDGQSNKLKALVKDTGRGISKSQKEKLFKPFEQGDTSVTRHFGGTGLGLVLSRALARGMDGDIVIKDSAVDIGTTFEILVDAGVVSQSDLIAKFKAVELKDKAEFALGTDLVGAKILVVDDAKENAQLFKMYLTQAGAKVIVANDGDSAINAASKSFFDLVLLDLQMPGKDGFQVLKELRSRAFTKPIVALTAHAMKEEKDKTKEAGFNDHITKPVQPKSLVESVAKLITENTIQMS